MVAELNESVCGITIGISNYNIMCYADDLLLCSTTVSGLQSLIDVATKYTVSHGLRFNPSRSVCFGGHL